MMMMSAAADDDPPRRRTESNIYAVNNNKKDGGSADQVIIRPDRTFDSSDDSHASGLLTDKHPLHEESSSSSSSDEEERKRPATTMIDSSPSGLRSRDVNTRTTRPNNNLYDEYDAIDSFREWATCALYVSLFSALGAVLRIYMGRLFGLDCDLADSDLAVDDFLTPLSSRICITASGKTTQTGGALFTDLPPNMLGWYV